MWAGPRWRSSTSRPELVEDQPVFKGQVRDLGFELGELLGKTGNALLELFNRYALPELFVTTKGVADDLGVAKKKIAAAVINVMVGVDQPGDRSSRHFLNRPEKASSHGRNHEGINRHDAFAVQ